MTTTQSERPEFVGINWASSPQGYNFFYRPPKGAIPEDVNPGGDEWLQLLCIFDRARRGVFDSLHLLPDIIRNSQDFHVRSAGMRLLGDASSSPLNMSVAEFYSHSDPDTRLAAYAATGSNGSLNLLRLLMEASLRLPNGIELDLLAGYVSVVLEREPDRFVEPKSADIFYAAVSGRIKEIDHRIGDNLPVLFGGLLNINDLVDQIMAFASRPDAAQYDGLVDDYLMKFEAMTGVLYGDWFDDDENIEPSEVLTSMMEFKNCGMAGRFDPGKRYFLGHVIDE